MFVCRLHVNKIIFVNMTKNGEYVNRRSYYRKRNNDRRIVRKPLLQYSFYLNVAPLLRWDFRFKMTRWRSNGICPGMWQLKHRSSSTVVVKAANSFQSIRSISIHDRSPLKSIDLQPYRILPYSMGIKCLKSWMQIFGELSWPSKL